MSRDALEQQINGLHNQAQSHADKASSTVSGWLSRGRRAAQKLTHPAYRRKLSRIAENVTDAANYHCRRARHQVKRYPVATVAIVACAVGAVVVVRKLLSSRKEG